MHKCKIVVTDEVNCKILDLELTDRKNLMKKFEFEIPGAKYLPAVRLGRWNGKTSYFSLGGSTFVNLLPEIVEYLDRVGYDIELEDQRDYPSSYALEEMNENTFSHKVWPAGHPIAGQPIMLRDYQVEIINNFMRNPQSLQEVATGAGKTLMTAALSYSAEKYGRSIVIVPNKSLVVQTEADYVNLGLDVGVYYGDRKELGKTHTICTWQSLNIMMKATKAGEAELTIYEFIEDVVCVIVDECFAKGTPVLTPNGYVPIETLKPGDVVINFDEESKIFKEDEVVKLHTNLTHTKSEKMYLLEMDDGSSLEVTGNHKFLTNCGWVRADELGKNHEIIDISINTSSKGKCHEPQNKT